MSTHRSGIAMDYFIPVLAYCLSFNLFIFETFACDGIRHIGILGGSETLTVYHDTSRELQAAVWTRSGDDIKSSSLSLIINNISYSDAGSYKSIVYYTTGFGQETDHCLQVQGYPFLEHSSNVTVEGEMTSLRCCIDFALEITHSPEFIFSVQTKRLSNISSFPSTSVNGHFRACNVVRFESHRRYLNQNLLCQVQNEHYVLNASTVLLVYYQPVITVISPLSLSVFIGSNVSIECQTDANPLPTVILQKRVNGYQWASLPMLPTITRNYGFITSWLFLFLNVQNEIEGTYRCQAFNGVGATAHSSALSITKISRIDRSLLPVILPVSLTLLIITAISIAACKYYRRRESQIVLSNLQRQTWGSVDNGRDKLYCGNDLPLVPFPSLGSPLSESIYLSASCETVHGLVLDQALGHDQCEIVDTVRNNVAHYERKIDQHCDYDPDDPRYEKMDRCTPRQQSTNVCAGNM
ncbi:uncharacterized protein [Apostichopus japonicus]|uniref:uncharacterized protein isoform X1 n=1 Tax=Stichopus japonicus TaxID=307972 RepID=UPI003AB10FCF